MSDTPRATIDSAEDARLAALALELRSLRGEVALLRAKTRTARALGGLSAAALVLGLGAMASPDPSAGTAPEPQASRVIQTKRLEIVDDAGRVALVATANAQGGRLDLWNAAGANIARLGSNDSGGDIILWNRDGSPAVSAYAQASGGRLELGGGGTRVAALLESSALGGRFALGNRAGNPVVGAAAFDEGGTLRVGNRENRDVAVLSTAEHGGSLVLGAGTGERFARLLAGEEGGELDLACRSGAHRVAASATEKEALVTTLSAKGAARLEATADGGTVDVLSSDGARLSSLEANAVGGVVVCRAGGERALASIGANPSLDRGGIMQLYNDSQAPVFAAAVNAEGAGRLALGTREGSATFIAESGGEDGASLSLSRAGRRALALLAGSNGGLLNLFSPAGTPVVVAGTAEDAAGGAVIVRGGEGKDLVRVGIDERGGGNVILFNKDASERRAVAAPR